MHEVDSPPVKVCCMPQSQSEPVCLLQMILHGLAMLQMGVQPVQHLQIAA